jgi:hypothetical protein
MRLVHVTGAARARYLNNVQNRMLRTEYFILLI